MSDAAALRAVIDAALREGRGLVRVASVDLWWPSPHAGHVEQRGTPAGVGWVRLELAA